MWYVAIFQDDKGLCYRKFYANGDMATAMVEWIQHVCPNPTIRLRLIAEYDGFFVPTIGNEECKMTIRSV